MTQIPDNLKCVIHNGTYFTHFFNGSTFFNELTLDYLYAHPSDIDRDNAYQSSEKFAHWPSEAVKDVPRAHYRRNLSYNGHDFSKDTFVETTFGKLPERVKKIFRRFETHDGFEISEAVDFHLNIIDRQ